MTSPTVITASLVLALLGQLAFSLIPPPKFECIPRATESPGDGCEVTESQEQLRKLCQNAEKICVTGMWAMYTEPMFGGDGDTALVYPINGQGPTDCTSGSVGAVMRQIKSLRAINYPPVPATLKDWAEFYTKAYFLGTPMQLSVTTAPAAGAIPADTGSVAFYLDTMHLLVCNNADMDATDYLCVCFNAAKSRSYMVPDLNAYPTAAKPLKKIATITPTATLELCTEVGKWSEVPVLNFARDGLTLPGLNETYRRQPDGVAPSVFMTAQDTLKSK